MFWGKKKKESYNRENQEPVIRSSICTGEKVAGFRDIHTGNFSEVMLIRDDKDRNEFLSKYDISAEEIKNIW